MMTAADRLADLVISLRDRLREAAAGELAQAAETSDPFARGLLMGRAEGLELAAWALADPARRRPCCDLEGVRDETVG